MSASLRKFRQCASGATAIEAALCLPVLVLMIMGVFWFGWSQHQLSTMRFAMTGAARSLVINPALTQSQLSTMVKNQMGTEAGLVTVTLAVNNVAAGREATLTGVYTSTVNVPLAGAFPISRTTTIKAYLPKA